MRPHPSASKVTSTTVSPWATKPVLAGEQLVVELHVRARETRRPSGGRGTAGRSSSATCRDGLKGPGRVGAGGGARRLDPRNRGGSLRLLPFRACLEATKGKIKLAQ